MSAFCEPSPGVWQNLTTVALTLSNVNFSVGLGSIVPTGQYGGTAEYSDFTARPYAAAGTWTSRVLDRGGVPSVPGVISWEADLPAGTGLAIQTRSSADGRAWSEWSPAYPDDRGSALASPMHRYLRVRALLTADSGLGLSPVLDWVRIDQPDFGAGFLKPGDVKAYPNPSAGPCVSLEYLLSTPASSVVIEVADSAGRALSKLDAPCGQGVNTCTLDTSGLANGVYLWRVKAVDASNGQETVVQKKFAVLR